ncbi:MAG: AAA family ATPase [Planctomycetota bacterium]
MRTIAIINQKGGCGKTTTSINLAAVLALRGHRTLLVDMDPQSHCALGLAVPDTQIERSTADLLRHGLDGSMSVGDVTWQISRGLDLAPSSMDLAAMEQQLSAAPDKDRRLVQVLSTVQDKYDFCIIDCPPSIGLLTFNALRAADEVLIPVETGYFAMQGSVRQEQTIDMLVRRVGHKVRFRVLPTMYDVRTKLAREILSELKKHFAERVLPLVINFNSKLKEAASFGQPITEYDAASRGMQDFEALAAWLLANPPAAPVSLPPQEDASIENGELADAQMPDPAPGNQPAGERTQPAAMASRSSNPALSRAAELVERARALSARTASLSERFKDDPDRDAFAQPIAPVTPSPTVVPTPPAVPQPAAASVTPPAAPTPTVRPDLLPRSTPAPALAPVGSPADAAAAASAPAASPPTSNGAATLAPQAPAAATPAVETLEEKLAKLYGVRHTTRGVLFVQPDDKDAPVDGNLAIAGDFNNWNPSQTPMTKDENLGVWRACVNVPPGRYRYRLVKNGQWVQDPFNRTVESNPFGELNNIIEIRE